MKLKAISRAFTVVVVVIYTVVLGLTSLAFEAQADLNQMLGTSQYTNKAFFVVFTISDNDIFLFNVFRLY